MRVWDLHPGYLGRPNLLGEHNEIHGLYTVITGGRKGFAAHPETRRWRKAIGALVERHDLTAREMELRGYNHRSPLPAPASAGPGGAPLPLEALSEQAELLRRRYRERGGEGRIPLPRRAGDFWAHHKYAVMARGYRQYREVQAQMKERGNPHLAEAENLLRHIKYICDLPLDPGGLVTALEHLWGYVSDQAGGEEKERFFYRRDQFPGRALRQIYQLAQAQGQPYLLHSTVFADLSPEPD